jgi:hypothetical protein
MRRTIGIGINPSEYSWSAVTIRRDYSSVRLAPSGKLPTRFSSGTMLSNREIIRRSTTNRPSLPLEVAPAMESPDRGRPRADLDRLDRFADELDALAGELERIRARLSDAFARSDVDPVVPRAGGEPGEGVVPRGSP